MKTKKRTGRDVSTFTFQRVSRGKGQTVIAVMQAYTDSRTVSHSTILSQFEGCNPYPIVMTLRKAQTVNDAGDHRRYFTNEDQLLKLKEGRFAITNQWTTETFEKFVKCAKKLGYRVTQD